MWKKGATCGTFLCKFGTCKAIWVLQRNVFWYGCVQNVCGTIDMPFPLGKLGEGYVPTHSNPSPSDRSPPMCAWHETATASTPKWQHQLQLPNIHFNAVEDGKMPTIIFGFRRGRGSGLSSDRLYARSYSQIEHRWPTAWERFPVCKCKLAYPGLQARSLNSRPLEAGKESSLLEALIRLSGMVPSTSPRGYPGFLHSSK